MLKTPTYPLPYTHCAGYTLDYAANSDLEDRPELTALPTDGGCAYLNEPSGQPAQLLKMRCGRS